MVYIKLFGNDFEKKIVPILFLTMSLIFANVGYNEYASVSFAAVMVLSYIAIKDNYSIFFKNNFVVIIFVIAFLFLYMYLLSDISNNEAEFFHSGLSHARESLMLISVIIYCSLASEKIKEINYLAVVLAGYIISAIIIIQYVQLSAGMMPLSLPQNWFMIDYDSTLLESFRSESVYIRPSAFYSEPSVVAAILVPIFFLQIKERNNFSAGFIATAIFLCGSIYGMVAAAIVLFIYYLSFDKLTIFIIICLLAILFLFNFSDLFFSDRLVALLYGEDESFNWRFRYPLEYLQYRWINDDMGPKNVQALMLLSKDLYRASIFDTWAIYTIAKLGFYVGIGWVLFVLLAIPRGILFLFIFYSFLSGAPLYHDKALMLMVCGMALLFSKNKKYL